MFEQSLKNLSFGDAWQRKYKVNKKRGQMWNIQSNEVPKMLLNASLYLSDINANYVNFKMKIYLNWSALKVIFVLAQYK